VEKAVGQAILSPAAEVGQAVSPANCQDFVSSRGLRNKKFGGGPGRCAKLPNLKILPLPPITKA